MRLAGRTRLGFYPLPPPEAERIRRFLALPDQQCCALDPCVGDGAAFAEIASDKGVLRYGVELDAGRANQARNKGISRSARKGRSAWNGCSSNMYIAG